MSPLSAMNDRVCITTERLMVDNRQAGRRALSTSTLFFAAS